MKLNKLYLFLFLVIGLSLLVFAQSIITMTGGTVKAIQNSKEVSYPVYLENNESVAGFQVDVSYTTFLTYKGIEATSRMPNSTIVVNNETDGVLKIAILIEDEIQNGDGETFNIIFDVDEFATPSNYTMNFSDLIVTNITADVLDVSEVDGVFEVVEPYEFVFLPPISNFENFTLVDGATLPLKFKVTDESSFIADDSVLVRIYNDSLGIDKSYNASGTGDDYVRIDEEDTLYIVNIHTNELEMPVGDYNIEVTFDNLQKEEIIFELVEPGPNNGKGKGRQK